MRARPGRHGLAGDAVKVKELQLLVSNPTNLAEGPSLRSRSGWGQTGPMEPLHVFDSLQYEGTTVHRLCWVSSYD